MDVESMKHSIREAPPHPFLVDAEEIRQLAEYFEGRSAQGVLKWAIDRFQERFALVTSFQLAGTVLIDMASRLDREFRVVTIDTGRLPQGTYELIDRLRERYQISVELIMPDPEVVQKMVLQHGVNLFYRDVALRQFCCHVRKVLPLLKVLEGLGAWGAGLCRGQSHTRRHIRKVELDHEHGGIIKINPLADWSQRDLWIYTRNHDVPYHSLYDQGYTTIGCSPCTRPILEGEDLRSGRWWWEEKGTPKECGMHCSLETGVEDRLVALTELGIRG